MELHQHLICLAINFGYKKGLQTIMRRDKRPYLLKKADLQFQEFYVRHFIKPQLDHLGQGFTFMKPWYVKFFGDPIRLGQSINIVATPDAIVRLSVWSDQKNREGIRIGDFCLICPGVRLHAASSIRIGDNCMIAQGAYITDSDWHDIYNRIDSGKPEPVTIAENVWIGDGAVICKGVTIGENSIIGAGSVVVHSIPPNSVAAGNPAKVMKTLDQNEKLVKRDHWFENPERLSAQIDALDQKMLSGNTLFTWFRSLLFPSVDD
ncbi:acyltransferase [Desulfobacterales bacterium HSG17]|nr:acyltransferase [Desulfobacterales bacterium HSG17]